MKRKIIVVLLMVMTLFLAVNTTEKVEASTVSDKGFSYDNDVWETIPGYYSDWQDFSGTNDIGEVNVEYLILRNTTSSEYYNYYLVLQVAHINLKAAYEDPTFKYSGFKDVWVNGGLTLQTDVDKLDAWQELYEYSPEQLFTEKSYKTEISASVEFGVEGDTTSVGAGISVTSGVSWVSDGRDIENKSRVSDELVKTRYRYDTAFEGDSYWKWWDLVGPEENISGTESFGNLSFDVDKYDEFNNTITERQAFVVRTLKTRSYFKIELEAYFTHINYDWDWINEQIIHQGKATRTISIANC
jgi:hypothetical protein